MILWQTEYGTIRYWFNSQHTLHFVIDKKKKKKNPGEKKEKFRNINSYGILLVPLGNFDTNTSYVSLSLFSNNLENIIINVTSHSCF